MSNPQRTLGFGQWPRLETNIWHTKGLSQDSAPSTIQWLKLLSHLSPAWGSHTVWGDSFLMTPPTGQQRSHATHPVVTHPLYPRVLQNLGSAESLLRISNQEFRDEVFGLTGDMSPVLVRKLIFAFLDALKQLVLGTENSF